MRLRAFSSGLSTDTSARCISSVWRFGRDSRHLTNKGIVDFDHRRSIVRNLQRMQISPDPGTNNGWTYFTLMPRYGSARKALTMALGPRIEYSTPVQSPGSTSARSHIHGSNRNRIALHVMLNERRNFTRCRFQYLASVMGCRWNRA
jgi:hypothetical protein